MTKHEKRIAELAAFSDEQINAEACRLMEKASELHSMADKMRRELSRRAKDRQRAKSKSGQITCGGGS